MNIPRLSSLTREDFFYPFEEHFNKIWDQFFGEGSSVKGRVGYPKMDIVAENGKWKVQVALPGVDPEDVTVEILPETGYNRVDSTITEKTYSHILKISGKMSEVNQSPPEAHYQVKELRRSAFERSIRLPDYVTGEPQAVMKDGLLSLTWNTPEIKVPQKKTIPITKQ